MARSTLIRAIIGRTDGPVGQVLLDGAWWTARSRDAPLAPGQHVRVVDLDGLELIVDPTKEEPS